MWQPGWEGDWEEGIHVCLWLSPFAVHLKHHNIAHQLYPTTKSQVQKEKKMLEAVIPPGELMPNTQECSKDPYILSSKLSELLSMVSWHHGGWCLN